MLRVATTIVVSAALSVAARSSASVINEQPFGAYVIGDYVSGLGVGDFNADGFVDLVLDGGSIAYGPTRERLQNPLSTVQGRVLGVVDLNSDGTSDIVLSNFILLGRANALPQIVPLSDAVASQADLVHVVKDGPSQPVQVLYAQWHTFRVATISSDLGVADTYARLGTGLITDLASGDLNGDRHTDVVVTYGEIGQIQIFLGQGNGRFTRLDSIAFPNFPWAAAVWDLDRDGRGELVLAERFSYELAIYRFGQSLRLISRCPLPALPNHISSADLDGDGWLDLYGPSYERSVWIALNDGQGGVRAQQSAPVGAFIETVAAADFDADGHVDLAVAPPLQIAFASGPAAYDFGSRLTRVGYHPRARVGSALVNLQDGGPADLVSLAGGYYTPLTLSFHQLLPDLSAVRYLEFTLAISAEKIRAEDLESDGDIDLVLIPEFCYNPCAVQSYINDGGREFHPGPVSLLDPVEFSDSMNIQLGHFNNDEYADLAAFDHFGKITLFTGQSNASFQPVAELEVPQNYDIFVQDLDGDGRDDILATDLPDVRFHKRVGPFAFAPAVSHKVGTEHDDVVALADMNGDGLSDLIASTAVFAGFGGGNFHSERLFVPSSPLLITDVDGDGDLDYLGAGSLLIWEDGVPIVERPLPAASVNNAAGLTDVDADGLPDLVQAHGSWVGVARARRDLDPLDGLRLLYLGYVYSNYPERSHRFYISAATPQVRRTFDLQLVALPQSDMVWSYSGDEWHLGLSPFSVQATVIRAEPWAFEFWTPELPTYTTSFYLLLRDRTNGEISWVRAR